MSFGLVGDKGQIGRSLIGNDQNRLFCFSGDLPEYDVSNIQSFSNTITEKKISNLVSCAFPTKLSHRTYSSNLMEQTKGIFDALAYFSKTIQVTTFLSGSIFGRENWNENLSEDDIERSSPSDDLGRAQLVAYRNLQGSRSRCLMIYGYFSSSDQMGRSLFADIVYSFLNNRNFKISANRKMSFASSLDLYTFLKRFSDDHFFEKFNVTNFAHPESILISEFADEVSRALGVKGKIIVEGQVFNDYTASHTKFKNECPDFHFIDLKDSIKLEATKLADRIEHLLTNNVELETVHRKYD